MSDAQARVRKCRERVPRSAGDDAGQMRLALVRWQQFWKRSGIGQAQGVGEAQQATTRDGVQGPAGGALTQPSGIVGSIGKLGIGLDFWQPVQRSGSVGQQRLQSWISFTSRDAGSDHRRLGVRLRMLLYLRIRALFARHVRRGAGAFALSGGSSDLAGGVVVHVFFMPLRRAAVKPRSKNSIMIADVIQKVKRPAGSRGPADSRRRSHAIATSGWSGGG